MLKFISKIFLKIMGWKLNGPLPPNMSTHCVVIAAPHTSNWDLPIAAALFYTQGIKIRFTIKKEWMFFPMGLILGALGAIPIDRSPKKSGDARLSTVEAMINLFKENEQLVLLVPPEASRSLREEWKTGFYHVAKGANVPIGFGYINYATKIGGIDVVMDLSNDMEADMKKIMTYYQNIKGKFPEKFSVDKRYI